MLNDRDASWATLRVSPRVSGLSTGCRSSGARPRAAAMASRRTTCSRLASALVAVGASPRSAGWSANRTTRRGGRVGDLDPPGAGGSPIAAAARAVAGPELVALAGDVAQAPNLDAEHRRDYGAAEEPRTASGHHLAGAGGGRSSAPLVAFAGDVAEELGCSPRRRRRFPAVCLAGS